MPRISGRSSDCLSIDNIYHSALFSDCKTVSLKTLLTAGLNPQAHYNLFPPDTVWSHHEETRELPGERDNARNNASCTQARKTTNGLDGQHQDVDRTPRGRVNQNNRDKRRKYVRGVANPRIKDG